MCERCVSTVRTLRKSCSPISAFVCPRAIRRRTSTSRSAEVVRRASAAAERFGGDASAELRVQIVPPAAAILTAVKSSAPAASLRT